MFKNILPILNIPLFDKILTHKDGNQHIVANNYLHILNAHPLFLEQYNLSNKAKIWLSIKSKLIFIIRIFQSFFYKQHYFTEKKGIKIDVLFVSHLTNNQQLLHDDDTYFGDLPNQLLEYNIRSGIALINHIGINSRKISIGWLSGMVQRFVLSFKFEFFIGDKTFILLRENLKKF